MNKNIKKPPDTTEKLSITESSSNFENLDRIIQEEPIDAISPEVRGAIAAIGIVSGKWMFR